MRSLLDIPALALVACLSTAGAVPAQEPDTPTPETGDPVKVMETPEAPRPPDAPDAAETVGAPSALEAARAYRAEHGRAILDRFFELVSIPNVATDAAGIGRNAEYLVNAFKERGAAMELLADPENPDAPPVVFGELPATAEAREGSEPLTLVLYAHYDGQPVDPEKWTHEPWSPTLYTASLEDSGWPRPLPEAGEEIDPEWRVYARSASDDKAPIQALLTALDALESAGVPRRVHLKLFFDGEEEMGSPHLPAVVEAHREKLAGDAWLFLDGPVHQTGRPQVFFGVRGYTGLELTVYGATRYLHSGHYGNWAPNPNLRLARLLASMKDEEGEVLIEGFYDSAEKWDDAALEAVETSPDFEDELRRELGLAESEGGNDVRYLSRMMQPSLNVRGIVGASVGSTARNVIPPQATASIDVRLVPGNDPNRMLALVEDHVRDQGYHVVWEEPTPGERLEHPKIARVQRSDGYRAVATSMDLPVSQAVIEATRRTAGNQDVVLTPILGGSLPLYVFEDALGAPPLIGLPIANHDNNQHAPDENLRLANLWYGVDLMAAIFTME